MSPRERLFETVELLEMVLLALPLREMLLARQISRTCQALIEHSAIIKHIRSQPNVVAQLHLPSEYSISAAEHPMLHVDLVLNFDRPVTVRKIASPLESPSAFAYKIEQGNPIPQKYFPYTPGGCFRPHALELSRKNDMKYLTLLPGTPYRLSFDFGLYPQKPGFEHLAPRNEGLNNLEVGKTYVLGVKSALTLPAFIGTKTSLLNMVDRGEKLTSLSFDKLFGDVVLRRGSVGKPLRLVGEDEVLFKVVD